MLHHLRITNIALIDEATLEFASGLCVLTGETGAGKSILLDALGLALGQRSDPRLLRHGATQGSVTASFHMDGHESLPEFLAAQGLPVEDTLILRRVITSDGRSKAFLNDAPISVALLKEVGEQLVEIHGQHDQRKLFSPAAQRGILDGFAGNESVRKKTQKYYEAWQQAVVKLAALEESLKNAHGEEDYLSHAVAELRKLNPQPGEEAELAGKRQLLMQREKSINVLSDALGSITGSTDAAGSLYSASRNLQRAAPADAAWLTPLTEALEKAGDAASEAQALLEKTLDDVQDGEARVDEVEERLFALRAAARKFQCPVEELAATRTELESRLAMLSSAQDEKDRLKQQIEVTQKAYIEVAEALRATRKKAAEQIEKAMVKELKPLKMEHAIFKVSMEPLAENQWSGSGMDNVMFLIQPNKGGTLEPLHKVASGGELSRIMLSLKCVAADDLPCTTLIFDEVDTGVSGAVAEAIGRRLKLLGKKALVLVVTHLPQVAVFGSDHLRVQKKVKGNETFTRIEALDEKARREEIARLLSGNEVTSEALAAAGKLLDAAV